MSRYINMDDVITYPVMPVEYRKYQTMNLDDAYEQGWDDLQTLIEKMPTADVRENVHGKWVGIHEYIKHLEEEYGERYTVSSVYDGSIFCNKCWGMAKAKTNFCPNCGADMRKYLKHADARDRQAEEMLPEAEDENDL